MYIGNISLKKIPSLLTRAFKKLVIEPLRYKKGADYEAEAYWKDRFSKHGSVLKAVGHEGLSEEENRKDYEEAAGLVMEVLENKISAPENCEVLEIGSGTGFYTGRLAEKKFKSQTAVDITDHFFPVLKEKLPAVKLIRKDVSTSQLDQKYDAILMIDVVQHIVQPEKFRFAMKNISTHLKKGGVFLVSGIKGDKGGKQLFYVQSWKTDEVSEAIGDLNLTAQYEFRRGTKLLVYEKQ